VVADYNNEQILSTTALPHYRSIGGASATLASQQFFFPPVGITSTDSADPFGSRFTAGNYTGGMLRLGNEIDGAEGSGQLAFENITGECYSKSHPLVVRKARAFLINQAERDAKQTNVGGAAAVKLTCTWTDGRGGEYPLSTEW